MSFTQEEIEVKRRKFEMVRAFYEGVEELDPEYVVEAVKDNQVRDALLHYASNKFQISVWGELECTLEDCSDIRKNLASMLFISSCEAGTNPYIETLIGALALLDGNPEASSTLVEGHEGTVTLARSIQFAVKYRENPSELFTSSVEAVDIEACLAGA